MPRNADLIQVFFAGQLSDDKEQGVGPDSRPWQGIRSHILIIRP